MAAPTQPQPAAQTADAEHFIRSWQAGERAAAREFYSLYKDRVYRWAFLKTRNPHAAEDLCQEVWGRIHRSLHTYRPGTNPNAWVYRILINAHRSLWRRGQHFVESLVDRFLEGPEAEPAGDAPLALCGSVGGTPESMLAHKQELAVILSALHEIPEIYRTVVILRIVEELPIEEVATILELSQGTVKSRLSRGVEKLRERLGQKAQSGSGGQS